MSDTFDWLLDSIEIIDEETGFRGFDNMTTLSDAQFAELLNVIKGNTTATVPLNTTGNFSNCKSSFSGDINESVEAFVDAIKIYKDCVSITEENALKGLPMLLKGSAASWWQGIKHSVNDFSSATKLLISTFGCKKPPYKIYLEIFSAKQSENMKLDIFVNKIRALFSQIPEGQLIESVQLDMIFGLLSRKIRQHIKRTEIKTFEELLEHGRQIEELDDDGKDKVPIKIESEKTSSHIKNRKYCNYCKVRGHALEDCRRLTPNKTIKPDSKIEQLDKPNVKPTQNYDIACYTCGYKGVIKSNCPQCNPKTETTSTSSLEFYSIESEGIITYLRPILNIEILGANGLGIVDTAAKISVAGNTLYQHLKSKNVLFEPVDLNVVLADGSHSIKSLLTTTVSVKIKNKIFDTTFLIFPNSDCNKTLLGIDFVRNAQLCLNFGNNSWSFYNDPSIYKLIFENLIDDNVQLSSLDFLREGEGTHLTSDQREIADQMLSNFGNIFSLGGEATSYAEHKICTEDHAPIACPPYKMPVHKKELLKIEIDNMLECDIIEECDSAWAAPVVLVPKKDDKVRVCIDYRKLNSITKADKYPMPRIDDIMQLEENTTVMSTIDLRSGYWQIKVAENDKDKTAFITPFGLYRFKRMPFGLKNAPATFQRLIDRLRAGLKGIIIFAYLDDILILSSSFDQHILDLKRVFERLNEYNLKANRDKCVFFRSSVKFLGHIVTINGIHTDPDKVTAITNMLVPRNVKHVKSFLQTCSWYRRFIPEFSNVAKPISSLTKKNAKWIWGREQQNSFDMLKKLLTEAPILRQADERLPFILRTDASNYALGAVLLQGEGYDERPIEFASRLLTSAEINYSTTEREALAVVWALAKFRGYIDGAEVLVSTDHQPLKWLMSIQSPSGRLARWALAIQSYNLRIDYTPGKNNVVADTLSRPPCSESEQNRCGICSVQFDLPVRSLANLRENQLSDPDMEKIITCFETPDHPDLTNWTGRGYIMNGGILYRYVPEHDEDEAQLCIPTANRIEILQQYHDSPTGGHYGADKTFEKIAMKYYWPGMRRYVSDYVRSCIPCQKYKATNLKPSGLIKTPVMSQRWEVISIDLFGPLVQSISGNKWVFIITDTSTRWVELFSLENATAEICAKTLISEVFMRYGIPRRIVSDNGPQFVSDIMQYVAHCLGIKQTLTPLYHPECNMVERQNRQLKTQLAILVNNEHRSWDEHLFAIRFAINSTKCDSTGYTPAFLNFGREIRCLADVHNDFREIVQEETFIPQITPYLLKMHKMMEIVRETHEHKQDQHKMYADRNRKQGVSYKPGDLVLINTQQLSNASKGLTSKFYPRRDGPYQIKSCKSSTTYDIESTDGKFIGCYHTSKITPFIGTMGTQPIRPIKSRGRPKKAAQPNQSSVSTVNTGTNINSAPSNQLPASMVSTVDNNQPQTVSTNLHQPASPLTNDCNRLPDNQQVPQSLPSSAVADNNFYKLQPMTSTNSDGDISTYSHHNMEVYRTKSNRAVRRPQRYLSPEVTRSSRPEPSSGRISGSEGETVTPLNK